MTHNKLRDRLSRAKLLTVSFRFWWSACALVSVVFAIGGCTESRRLVLELEEGYLEAPNGNRVPLGLPVDPQEQSIRAGWHRRASMEFEGYQVRVALALVPQTPNRKQNLLVDVTRNGFTRAAILSSEAYFRRGDRPKEPIVLLESTDSHYPDQVGAGLGGSTHRLVFEAPAALVALSASEPGDPEVEYTLHLPFRLGDKRWVHHMRFRVEVRSDWYFAAPATP